MGPGSSSGTTTRRSLVTDLAVRNGTDTTSSSSVSSIISLPDLYLTTGLATLACFYISLYLLPLLLLRRLRKPPPAPDPDRTARKRKPWRVAVKVFAFRFSMLAVFVEFCTVLGIAGQSTRLALQVRTAMNLTGAQGVGGGTIGKCHTLIPAPVLTHACADSVALHIAWIFLFYAWLVEWSAPKGTLHRYLAPRRPKWLLCGLDSCCGCGPNTTEPQNGDPGKDRVGSMDSSKSTPLPTYSKKPEPPTVAHMRRPKGGRERRYHRQV
jgi:hypothetical protein